MPFMQNMPSRKQIALVCMRPSNSLFASIIRREGNLHSAIVHSLFLVWGLLYSTRRYGIFQETSKNFHMKKLDFNPLTQGRFSDPYFKVLWEGGKTKFLDFFYHRGIRNKKVCKVKNFLKPILGAWRKEHGAHTFFFVDPFQRYKY